MGFYILQVDHIILKNVPGIFTKTDHVSSQKETLKTEVEML